MGRLQSPIIQHTRLPSGVMSCEYANTIHPIVMLFGGFLALLVEPPLLSWDPPAIVPIPSKLGVPLISVLSLLRVACAASGARKSPSFDEFGHLIPDSSISWIP